MFSSNFTNRFLIISHGFGVDYWLGKTGPINVDVFVFLKVAIKCESHTVT